MLYLIILLVMLLLLSIIQYCYLSKTEKILERYANLQGHNICHYHPEILDELCDLYRIKKPVQRILPPLEEYKEGCRKEQEKLYGDILPPSN